MTKTTALIFGFNKYSLEIVTNIDGKYSDIKIFSLDEKKIGTKESYDVQHFDLSDDWTYIDEIDDIKKTIAFCVLEDMAENIFLTISLRSNFKDLTIIAIASHKENANKLSMAGANKVIPLVETTSDIMANMIENPISNTVLHSILYEESDLKIAQIQIKDNSHFKDEKLADIDWTRYQGIIVLSVMHEDMSSEFIYSSKAKHHIIKSGDILVIVGYEEDIKNFEETIGSERYVNWSDWSW